MATHGTGATLRIPAFLGLWQHGDGAGSDLRRAVESVNALTRQGVLRPKAQCAQQPGTKPAPHRTPPPALPQPPRPVAPLAGSVD